MATSDIAICSKALALLGLREISSFDDGPKGRVCGQLYDGIRDALVSEYPWRFTMQKRQLGRLSSTPTNKWKYAYQMPSDIEGSLVALYNSGDEGAVPVKEWEQFGRVIFTDYTEVYVDYKVTPDEADFPPHFEQLLTFDIAWQIAEPLTDDTSKVELWNKVARGDPQAGGKGGYFAVATSIDAQGSPTPHLTTNDFSLIAARVGSTR